MSHAAVPVRFAIEDGLAVITLARPEAGNAMNWALVDAFADAAERAAADETVRAVLLRSEGKNFSVGGDIKVFAAEADPGAFLDRLASRIHVGVAALATAAAPVVVAVQGAAAGAGLSLVAGGDVVIAGRSSSYVMAYAAIGLVADGGATWFLPRLIGLRLTQDMAYLQRRLDADEALAHGLVTRLVDDDAVQAEAEAVARRLAAGPTFAYRRIKRLLADSAAASLEAQLAGEARAMGEAMAGGDARNAVAAFLERRTPSFDGR